MNNINNERLLGKKKEFDYSNYKNQIANIKNSWLCKTPIAHRGTYDNESNAPENSLPAFQNSIDKGYAIELDIHQLKDGNFVVFHDNSLERACGKKVRVSSLTLEEIKQYKLFGTNETIPTLDEVLEKVNGQVPLLIEVKDFNINGKLESNLYSKLKKYDGDYAIEAFNPFTLSWFKNNAPEVIRGQLIVDVQKIFGVGNALSQFFINCKSTMPHFIAPEASAVTKLDNGDKPVITWTVKTKEQYDKVMQNCDNAIFEKFNPLKIFTQANT